MTFTAHGKNTTFAVSLQVLQLCEQESEIFAVCRLPLTSCLIFSEASYKQISPHFRLVLYIPGLHPSTSMSKYSLTYTSLRSTVTNKFQQCGIFNPQ